MCSGFPVSSLCKRGQSAANAGARRPRIAQRFQVAGRSAPKTLPVGWSPANIVVARAAAFYFLKTFKLGSRKSDTTSSQLCTLTGRPL